MDAANLLTLSDSTLLAPRLTPFTIDHTTQYTVQCHCCADAIFIRYSNITTRLDFASTKSRIGRNQQTDLLSRGTSAEDGE
ncbi:hypothetical protein RB195_013824 [Necator americanus]|uniref:Uncharacterized protein n=1 Tax=Necator americanus TaxID=51031 RepID=A0ABR1DXX2_NECAM